MTTVELAFATVAFASPPPEPQTTWAEGQPWPVVLDAGVQALGFSPLPANPTVSVGTELSLVRRRVYHLALGLAIGGSHQVEFARSGFADTTLAQRVVAPFGLYGGFDLLVGGQLSAFPGVTYAANEDGRLGPRRAPVRPAARLGAGLEVGFDLHRVSRAPLRLFVRYRQLALTPFMRGNGLLAMGVAALTGGIAVEVGTWARR